MAIQSVNLGAAGTGAGGDTLRVALQKINANFSAANHAASKLAQASVVDPAAGALLMLGAFGLAGSSIAPTLNGQDLNALVTGGYWNCTGPLNAPGGATSTHHVLVLADSVASGRHVQIAQVATSSDWHWRSQAGGVWSPWVRMFHAGNVVGTVSQEAGFSTGAIIERGVNANGNYTKWADGTLECWHTRTDAGVVIGTGYFGGFRAASLIWAYPASFVLPPVVIPNSGAVSAFGVQVATPSTLSCNYCHNAITAQPAADRVVSLYAKGRWT